jgi:hypothetical protein
MATDLTAAVEKQVETQVRDEPLVRARCGPALPPALAVITYAVATWATNAHFMADTADYVDGVLRGSEFWEFGHLFWRPLGWLLFESFGPLAAHFGGANEEVNVTSIFMALNWLAGLMSVALIYGLARVVAGSERIAVGTAVAFTFSHGFLNFAQTGSSYIPGLALLLLALYVLAKGGDGPRPRAVTALAAGLLLACAVCMWFLYVWAVPAALALPLFLFGADRARRRLALQTAATFAVATALIYAAVLIHLGIHDPADLRAWIAASSHSVSTSGLTRAAFGLPRSLINMGNDGMLFKRFLLGDPLNPVSALDLFRLSLWKVALVYLFLGAVVVNLLRSAQGKRVLGLLVVSAIPLMAFAVMFDGGAVERYLPIYPLIFLSLSCSLSGDKPLPSLRLIALGFVIAASAANLLAMAAPVLDRQQESVGARIRELQPALGGGGLLATINQQDELVNFQRSFPFHPINSRNDFHVYSIVAPNTAQASRWREEFARAALAAWREGRSLWVTRRVAAQRPEPGWNWVEGDDRRVSWSDIHHFFTRLEMGDAAGGDDGFTLVPQTRENERLLGGLAAAEGHVAEAR